MPGDRIFVAKKCSLEHHRKFCEGAACACPTDDGAIASLPVYSNAALEVEGAVVQESSPEVIPAPKPEPTARRAVQKRR